MKVERRNFIKIFLAGTFGLAVLKFASLFSSGARSDVVRPPGAVDEEYFNLLCVRCGICLEVCPTKAIVLAGFKDGLAAVNTPKIEPLIGPCEFFRGRCEDVMLCSKFCPTHALQLSDRDKVKLGSIRFNPDLCLAYMAKECVVCDEMCPVQDAITLTRDLTPVFHEDECVGCGICVNSCPADPKALTLIPKGAKRTKWPK